MRKAIGIFGSILLTVIFWAGSVLAAEQVFFYHTDPAGTPLAMTDSTGKVVWKADYKPFGEEQSVTATTPNDKRFVGKEKDEETGLSYFGARYQNAKTGRFISPDPVRAVNPRTSKTNENILVDPQRLNTYAYGLNNPYRYIDPDGQEVIVIGTSSYQKQVNGDLSRAKAADPRLKNMITNLENSKNVHEITMTASGEGNSNKTTGIIPNESNGIGTSSTTFYDPNNHYTYQGKRDPAVGLTHELTHASDKDQGIMNRTINPTTNTRISEERAMQKENIMRSHTGDTLRNKY